MALELTSAQLAPLEALFDESYPERLREVATFLYQVLMDAQSLHTTHGAERLALLALEQTELLSQELGGDSFYMHKAHGHRLAQRNRQIGEEHNGRNLEELVKKYDLCKVRIRQIVADWERRERARRQGSLPLGEADP
jgi:Mor family transcriptional regulator